MVVQSIKEGQLITLGTEPPLVQSIKEVLPIV